MRISDGSSDGCSSVLVAEGANGSVNHQHGTAQHLPVVESMAAGEIGPTGRPLPNFPEPPPLTTNGPARIIAMCNQKGGVGKTKIVRASCRERGCQYV